MCTLNGAVRAPSPSLPPLSSPAMKLCREIMQVMPGKVTQQAVSEGIFSTEII